LPDALRAAKETTVLMQEFVVPRWLRSPHLQTLGAAAPLFSPPRSHATAEEELRIPLDERHKLHGRVWWASAERAPAVIVVHGIGGSSESRYVVRAGVALHRAGYHVVRLDLRGAGGSIVDAPSLYHAGLTSDLALVCEHVARDPRVSGVALFGFSGGGTMSLKLASEWGRAAPEHARAIVSISAPLDYTRVAPWMDSLGRIAYRFHVLRGLSNGARAFARLRPDLAHYRPEDVKRMSSFRHYDGTIIVPMHGFSDVDEYYAAASAGPLLDRVTLPALLVHAEDDPMVPGFTVKPWLERASSSIDVSLSPNGGHIGWVAGFDEASWIESWAIRRALDFLREKLRA
jgi:predicted alpha/beta-fold hydrolase